MSHFKLTSESKVNSFGKTLYRVEATKKFNMVGPGVKGGWVESESNLSGYGWVEDEAEVFDNATVTNMARVTGNSQVYGDASILNRAVISGNAQVYENAIVTDQAKLWGKAEIYGNAIIKERARVFGNTKISGTAEIWGRSKFEGGSFTETPYQFRGTRGDVSFVNISDPSTLRIGCVNESFTKWFSDKEAIAAQHGLTPEQLAEYTVYLNEAAAQHGIDPSVN